MFYLIVDISSRSFIPNLLPTALTDRSLIDISLITWQGPTDPFISMSQQLSNSLVNISWAYSFRVYRLLWLFIHYYLSFITHLTQFYIFNIKQCSSHFYVLLKFGILISDVYTFTLFGKYCIHIFLSFNLFPNKSATLKSIPTTLLLTVTMNFKTDDK